jgi:hypothetical protein
MTDTLEQPDDRDVVQSYATTGAVVFTPEFIAEQKAICEKAIKGDMYTLSEYVEASTDIYPAALDEIEKTTKALMEMCAKYAAQAGEIERLQHDLRLNASMLARQCDMARDAETQAARLRNIKPDPIRELLELRDVRVAITSYRSGADWYANIYEKHHGVEGKAGTARAACAAALREYAKAKR